MNILVHLPYSKLQMGQFPFLCCEIELFWRIVLALIDCFDGMLIYMESIGHAPPVFSFVRIKKKLKYRRRPKSVSF
jgi:hypothetical protein